MGSGLNVGNVMNRKVVIIDANKSIKEAAKLMAKHNIGSVIVVEKDRAKGIITERDIVRKIVAEERSMDTKCSDIMSHPLVVITPDASIEAAARIMRDSSVKKLPVIEKDGTLVGIITEDDIMKLFPSIVDLLELKRDIEI